MSIAGGYYRAIEAAEKATCQCVQIFTKNNNQWKAKAISDEDVLKFQDALNASSISDPLSHSSYLINLGTPDPILWKKSVDAFVIELQRAEQLGIPYVVLHPGAYTSSSEEAGIEAIVSALNEIHRQTSGIRAKCLLETTAGQGTTLGWQFGQLGKMIDGVQEPDRLGICFDTCHVYAAGYALSTQREYGETMQQFDEAVGLSRIRAFHLNDSKRAMGSRVDRHENIGQGHLGEEAFANLLSDARFVEIPMYLETPKGKNDAGEDMDLVNLALLRRLSS